MIDGQHLPIPLSAQEAEKLERHIATLQGSSEGNGFVGIWCEAAKQVFVAVARDGQLGGWVLMPATSEPIARRLAERVAEHLLEVGQIIANGVEEEASGAIRRAFEG